MNDDHGARATGEFSQGDELQAEPFDGEFLAEAALTALKASHRDAAWVASAALNAAMRRELSDDFWQAMKLANKAIRARDAIAARIALLEPEIGKAIAARDIADHEQGARVLH